MKLNLNVFDYATKAVKESAKTASKEMSKAIVAAGFELNTSLKEGMKREAPGGAPWPVTSQWTKYRLLTKAMKRNRRRQERIMNRAEEGGATRKNRTKSISVKGKTTALRKLAGAPRVKYYVNMNPGGAGIKSTKVQEGFVTPNAAKWAAYHATGPHSLAVTPAMRRMIFAAGLIIRASRILIPRRRTVDVVYEKNENVIPDFVNKRVAAAMRGQDPKGIRVKWQ